MNKNNFYKKVIVSLSGAALLTAGLSQMPNNVLNNTPVEVSAAKKTKVIGANSAVYKPKGKKMVKTGKILKVGKKVSVSRKKTVKGKVYYKIGKKQYIKAVNVDGKNRKAAKKTVLYTRKGKAIKNSKIVKGQKVKIYGAAIKIKGKKYYSTRFGYIKASALAKKEPAIDNNDVEKPNENNTTPTNKPDSGNNTTPAANSTNVPNTSGSSSTNPSVPAVDPVKEAKDKAVKEIKAAATEAKAQIAGNKNLTDEQKTIANDAIDKAVTDAIGQDEKSGTVNAAAGADKVTEAEEAAKDAIDNAVKEANTAAAKDAAIKEIKDKAAKAKSKIDGIKNLTDKQQKDAKDAIDKAVNDAIGQDEKGGVVNAATTTDKVTEAEEAAKDAIDKAVTDANDEAAKNLQDAKDKAVKDIKEAQNNAVNLIKSSPLTDDEKQTAINQIEDIVKSALGEQKDGKSGSVHDATTVADVEKVTSDTKAKCELVGNKIVSNDLAKQEGDFVKDAVAKMDDGDAKTAAPDKIAKAVKDAKDAIANAKSQAELDKAETDFQNALNDAVPFAKQQEYAVDTINSAVKTAKDEINNDDWMSEDEKNATLSEIDTVVKLALGEKQDGTSGDVHDAKTTSDIFSAVNTVLATCRVQQINDSLKKQKDAAIKEINQAADDAIQVINDTPASTENKQAAINKINAIVKDALGEQKDGSTGDIHDAKSGSEVSVIKNKVIKACKLEEDKLTSSELVSQVSDFASESATKMDDGDAKTAAPGKIAEAVKAAKAAIAAAKSQADLDKAEADFQSDLNNAVPFAKQQEYAKDKINSAVTDAKAAINNNTTLSKDEKDAALSKIDTVVKVALGEKQDGTSGDVHDAKTTSDIFTAVNTVLATCKAEHTNASLKKQKDAAIEEINQAAEDAIHTVTGSPASKENMQAAVDRINAIVKNALGEQKDGLTGDIHDAMSEDEINTIKEQVAKACELEGKKLASSELVSQVSDFASKSVANMDDGDAKTAASGKIAKAVKAAKGAIANAKSQADLDKAEAVFQSALNDAVPFAKQQAYTVDSINNAVKAAKDKIKNDGLLTDSDKEEKLALIDAVVKSALGEKQDGTTGDVHDATTTNDLLLAQNSVITVCN